MERTRYGRYGNSSLGGKTLPISRKTLVFSPTIRSHRSVRPGKNRMEISQSKKEETRCCSMRRVVFSAQERFYRRLSVVANRGSEARDHLANERTFLAWSRTGLGFVGAGLAYFYASTEQRLVDLEKSNVMESTALLIGNGLVFLGFATLRYFKTMECLKRGVFPLNSGGIFFIISCTGFSTIASLGLILQDRLEREQVMAMLRNNHYEEIFRIKRKESQAEEEK